MPSVVTKVTLAHIAPLVGPVVTRSGNRVDVVVTTYAFCKVTARVIERDMDGKPTKWSFLVEDV